MENNNTYYNKNLQKNANKLRHNKTKAEACLWKYVLKDKKLEGLQFRRQRPVLHYIADFLCTDIYLIIEVDGNTHNFEDVIQNDINRQNELEANGFIVVRFQDAEVLNNIGGVRANLIDVVNQIKLKKCNPPPTPASGGQNT